MINNNMEMLKQMDNPFSYEEYLSKCKILNIESADLQRFCLGIGHLMVGLEMFGREDWQRSYIAVFDEIARLQKIENEPSVAAGKTKKKKKSSCCGQGEKKSPNLAQKGINFAKALTEHIMTGKKHVPDSVYFQRLEKCRKCPSKLEGFVCAECGCYMGIKASWAEQKCKLSKW